MTFWKPHGAKNVGPSFSALAMRCARCGEACDEAAHDLVIVECTKKECNSSIYHLECAEEAVDLFQRRQTAGSRRDLDDKKLRRHDYTGTHP